MGQLLGATPLALAARAFGWRAAILSTAMLSLASTLAILVTVRDHVRKPGAGPVAKTPVLAGSLIIVRLPALRAILPLVLVSYAVVISERSLWIGPFLGETRGLDAISIGNVALLMSLLMALGAFAFGPAERLMRGPKMPALVASLLAGIAFIALAAWPASGLAVTVALISMIGFLVDLRA